MTFDSISPEFPSSLTGTLFFLALLCAGVFVAIEKNELSKEKRKRTLTFTFLAFIGFISTGLLKLPLENGTRIALTRFITAWFASLPFFHLLIFKYSFKRDEPEKKERIAAGIAWAATGLVMIYIIVWGIGDKNVLAVYTILWAATVALWIYFYTCSLSKTVRSRRLQSAAVQFLLGIGFVADAFLVGGFQQIPVLTLTMPLLGLFMVTESRVEKHSDDSRLTASYLIMPVVAALALVAAYYYDQHLTAAGKPLYIDENRKAFTWMFALTAAVLYIPMETAARKIASSFGKRLLSPLHKAVLQLEEESGKDMSWAEFKGFLNKNGFNNYALLERCVNTRRYRMLENHTGLESKTDNSTIGARETREFTSEGMLWAQKRSLFYQLEPFKSFSSLESRGWDGLALAVGAAVPSKSLPPFIIVFLKEDGDVFGTDVVRSLTRLCSIFQNRAFEKWKNKNMSDLSGLDWTGIQTIDDISGFLSKCVHHRLFSNADVGLFVQDRGVAGKIPPGFDANSFVDIELSGLKKDKAGLVVMNETGVEPVRCLPLKDPSGKSALVFSRFPDDYVHETFDPGFLERIAERTAFTIDRLILESLVQEQAKQADVLQKELGRQLRDQKTTIASDIHDTIAQEVYAAKLQIGFVEMSLKDSPPRTAEELKGLKSTVEDALRHSREIIKKLSQRHEDRDISPVKELQDFIEKLKRDGDFQISDSGIELLNDLTQEKAREMSMVVREALNNVRKHADADRVHLRLKKTGLNLRILVVDDGKGYNSKSASLKNDRFGLKSIKSRCRRCGANFLTRSIISGGTCILAVCPIDNKE